MGAKQLLGEGFPQQGTKNEKAPPPSVQGPGQFCPSSILSWFVNNNDYSPCPPDSPKSGI